jgi:hypothetical protein
MLLASTGAGDLCLRRFHFRSGLERFVFTLALGLGLCALALFALGCFAGLRRSVIWSLTVAGAAGAFLRFGREFRSRRNQLAVWLDWRAALRAIGDGTSIEKSGVARRPLFVEWGRLALFIIFLGYGALILFLTQYPPLQWDAIGNHLVLAREYLTVHRMVAHPGIAQPVLPALNHLLFAWGMALADDVVAQMVEYTFLILTALGLYSRGRREGWPGAGTACAALWLSHPLTLWLGEASYVDVCAASYAFLGVYALRVFRDGRASAGQEPSDARRNSAWWLLGMALLGMAAGAKMNAALFPILGAGFGLWMWARSRINWRQFACGLGLCFILTVPWYALITFYTGNPIWPMPFPFQIGSPRLAVPAYQAAGAIGVGMPVSWGNFLRLPVMLVTDLGRFAPDDLRGLSALVALWPLAWVLAIWNRSIRWWTLWAAAYTAFWFMTAQFVRYWTPALPLVGISLCESFQWLNERVWKSKSGGRWVWVLLTLGALSSGLWTMRKEVGAKGIRVPASAETREAFLTRLLDGYSGVAYVNAHAMPGDAIYLVNGNYLSYYCRPRVIGFVNVLELAPDSSTILWPGAGPRRLPQDQNGRRPTWILMARQGSGLSPAPGPGRSGAEYQLVYEDRQSYVFHLAPALPVAGTAK